LYYNIVGLEVVSSGKLYIDISYMPQLGLWPAKLVVTIKRAEQLRGGISLDPYVIAYVGKKITSEKYLINSQESLLINSQ
jgi:hypothetical protein